MSYTPLICKNCILRNQLLSFRIQDKMMCVKLNQKLPSLAHRCQLKMWKWCICPLGHTPPHSVTSIKPFSPEQATNFLLTISDLMKSNFLCPQIEKDPPPPQERSLDMPRYYKADATTNSERLPEVLNSLSTTRAKLPREWIQGTV
jgi:hypothetical protein